MRHQSMLMLLALAQGACTATPDVKKEDLPEFALFDSNSDNEISEGEWDRQVRQVSSSIPDSNNARMYYEDLRSVFLMADKNSDRKISREEWRKISIDGIVIRDNADQ